ncbi:MAG: Hpt domain-containing protein, partial [Burkholderiaceae bacterium]|nr:Hpt domain-containing protein [Burkholderiaceae bacterium]
MITSQQVVNTPEQAAAAGMGDLGPLAWVLEETRKSIESAVKFFKRFTQEAQQARGVDMGAVDTGALRMALQQLHQVVGALEMVGQGVAAQMVRAMEGAAQQLAEHPDKVSEESASELERAGFALIEYLESQLGGRTRSAVGLFPQFRDISKIAGAASVHPADLWPYTWRWTDPATPASAQPLRYEPQVRQRLDHDTLQMLKNAASAAEAELSEICLGLATGEVDRQPMVFWKLSAAFFEALALGLTPVDLYVKRTASKVLLQYAALARGDNVISERLTHDLLFFCAQAKPADDVQAPALRAVRQAWGLDSHTPVNYQQLSFGLFDPATLAQAKRHVETVKEYWSALSGGELSRARSCADQFALVAESLVKLHPKSQVLADALTHVARQVLQSGKVPAPELAMEVATAVLFLGAAFEDFHPGDQSFEERMEQLARRLKASSAGGASLPLDPWMEELYRKISDKQTMGTVVGELRQTMAEAEQHLDQFFRNPSDKSLLGPVPGLISQMRGVLSVLGLEQAVQAVVHMRDSIDGFLDSVDQTAEDLERSGEFERLGQSFGALGFLVDMLGYQPALAKRLFIYDPETGVFKFLVERTAVEPGASSIAVRPGIDVPIKAPAKEAPESALPQQNHEDASGAAFSLQPAEKTPAAERGGALIDALWDETDPTKEPKGTLGQSQDAAAAAATDSAFAPQSAVSGPAALAPEPATAPLPEAVPLAAAEAPAVAEGNPDDELLDIFLEEAREVVQTGQSALGELARNPSDMEQQTTLRRAFHTLKGSSRMVGLAEFGEAAWAMEQVLNAWLPEEKPVTPQLRELTSQSLGAFARWVDAIADGKAHAWSAEPFRVSAEAMRLRSELIPLQPAVDEAPPPEAQAPVAAATEPATEAPAAAPEPPAADDEARPEPDSAARALPPETAAVAEKTAPASAGVDTVGFEIDPLFDSATETPAADATRPEPDSAARALPPETAAVAEEATPASAGIDAVDFEIDPLFDSATETPAADATRPEPDSAAQALPPEAAAVAEEAAPAFAGVDTVDFEIDPLFDLASGAGGESSPEDTAQATATGAASDAADAPEEMPQAQEAAAATTGTGQNSAAETERFFQDSGFFLADEADTRESHSDAQTQDAVKKNSEIVETAAESAAPVAQNAPSGPPPAVEEVELSEDGEYKQIGDLRISIALYNVYLGEADEWSRQLSVDLSEWALELHQPVPERAVHRAHSLAGSSATVGLMGLSTLARAVEHAMQRMHGQSHGTVAQAEALLAASEEIRRVLHQFAAGLLKEPGADILEKVQQIEYNNAAAAAAPSDVLAQEDAEDAAAPTALAPMVSVTPLRPMTREAAAAPSAAPERIRDVTGDEIDVQDALDPDLFPIFEEEAEELLPKLSATLREWVAQPSDQSARQQSMRALHTLKGGARLAGALRLGEMAHRAESAIEQLGHDTLTPEDLEPLLDRLDAMEMEFRKLQGDVDTGMSTLSAPLVATAQEVTPAPVPAEPSASSSPAATQEAAPDAGATAEPAAATTATIAPVIRGEVAKPAPLSMAVSRAYAQQAVRVRSQLLDRLVNQAGEVITSRVRLESELGQLKGSLGDLTGNLERLRLQLRDVELQAETQMQSRLALTKDAQQNFDPLEFDRFTRMQELTRMMAESVNDVATVQRNIQRAVDAGEADLAAQARQARELQRDLLRTRMVEFDSLSERLYRLVRQAAKETGKQVKLDIVGGSIEMDRGILERMTPAFEHLLRNCVVHGIEPPEVRAARAKDGVGTITIEVQQAGNDVSVTVRDDGGGLPSARIRERAIQAGLIQPAQALGPAEIGNLIFAPGLTTATEVTGLAGRGVGMDVVRTEMQALGGRIETSFAEGLGTAFKLIMPLTTAVTHVVMVRAGNLTIGVPSHLVELVRRVSAKELQQAYNSSTLSHEGADIAFFWAGALLQSSPRTLEPQAKTNFVLVFRSAEQRVALHVDEVLGNQEVVVKSLGPQLSRLPGLVAITALSSGKVTLIYNPVALAQVHGQQARAFSADHAQPEVIEQEAGQKTTGQAPAAKPPQAPLVLVVDDSITVRRVTQRLLQREGYRVALANDGLQGLERLQQERPQVVLSDIEMPRMDGFDFVRNIRADEKLKDLPVIMITSRIAEKHRDHAHELGVDHYLGKPYSEEDLLSLIEQYTHA